MMTVILYDKDRATRMRIEHVTKIESGYCHGKGRMIKSWNLSIKDAPQDIPYKMVRYDIERVELEVNV
ncbi:MAG: hypothetical protein II229_00245 [Clostridia bacterium]|nr:hypothetical protein [Clostridia bacterium]